MNKKFEVNQFLWARLTRNINTHVHRDNNHPDEYIDSMTGEIYTEAELNKFKSFGLIIHDSFDDYLDYMNGLVNE